MAFARLTLSALVLSMLAAAATPTAQAGPVCDVFDPSPLIDDTTGNACSAECYYETAPNAWANCNKAAVQRAAGTALCYAYTAPIHWVPDCT